jgi:hypothetical protein
LTNSWSTIANEKLRRRSNAKGSSGCAALRSTRTSHHNATGTAANAMITMGDVHPLTGPRFNPTSRPRLAAVADAAPFKANG